MHHLQALVQRKTMKQIEWQNVFLQRPHPIIRAKYMQMPLCLPENTISGPIIPLMDVPGWDMEFPGGNMGVDIAEGCKPRVKIGKYYSFECQWKKSLLKKKKKRKRRCYLDQMSKC